MQLKNNQTADLQLHYPVNKNGQAEVDFIHIPGGATVEIEDSVFELLCKSTTRIEVQNEVVTELETEVPVTMDKKQVAVKDYHPTGRFRTVNLFKQRIKDGELTIVERPAVAAEVIDKFLTSHKIDITKMSDEDKLKLYDKLA